MLSTLILGQWNKVKEKLQCLKRTIPAFLQTFPDQAPKSWLIFDDNVEAVIMP
jgi:hypothetical protein